MGRRGVKVWSVEDEARGLRKCYEVAISGNCYKNGTS